MGNRVVKLSLFCIASFSDERMLSRDWLKEGLLSLETSPHSVQQKLGRSTHLALTPMILCGGRCRITKPTDLI